MGSLVGVRKPELCTGLGKMETGPAVMLRMAEPWENKNEGGKKMVRNYKGCKVPAQEQGTKKKKKI